MFLSPERQFSIAPLVALVVAAAVGYVLRKRFAPIKHVWDELTDNYFIPTTHPFNGWIVAMAGLAVYEVLLRLSHAKATAAILYNAVDVWYFIAFRYLPFGTLFVSLGLIGWFGWNALKAQKGVPSAEEAARRAKIQQNWKSRFGDVVVRREKNPKGGEIRYVEKVEYAMPPVAKYKPAWNLVAYQLPEGIIRGSLLMLFLTYLTYFTMVGFLGTRFFQVPIPLDALPSLRSYQTTVFQDIALAIGGSCYDEFLFRQLLWNFLAPRMDFSLLVPFTRIEFHIGEHIATIVCAFIYALSAIIFGDNFSYYHFFYRLFFGIALYRIQARRGLGVAITTHFTHDLWYFGGLWLA